jgi:hypothetical protein
LAASARGQSRFENVVPAAFKFVAAAFKFKV